MDGTAPAAEAKVSYDELLELCAVDSQLFAHEFFPRTARLPSPPMHDEIWTTVEGPGRYINLIAPRGFSKTSLLRIYTAKRIAYSVSRTILYIGASEDHARRSIMWLRSAIEKNTKFTSVYNLAPGVKWTETELEILHGFDPLPIWIQGVGVTGNLRGINFEDYRPDLIICDDILTDENTATRDQRDKLADLIMNAVRESLASEVEMPNAKMVMLDTPHIRDDVVDRAAKSSLFITKRFSCWTSETEDLPLEQQVSAWPEMKPTEVLRREKAAALAENRYSDWAAENECKIVTREELAFRPEWLTAHAYTDDPGAMHCVLAIDPVPPPSERQLARSLRGKDFEAQVVLGRKGGEYYVLDYAFNRGHEPNWSVATALSLARTYRISRISVESVAYQRVLKYLLEMEMRRRGIYYVVNPYVDTRKKFVRIVSTLSGPASAGKIHVSSSHHDLIAQWSAYRKDTNDNEDDLLDALAIAMSDLANPYLEHETPEMDDDEDDFRLPELEVRRLAP